jgi:hypothetical protein
MVMRPLPHSRPEGSTLIVVLLTCLTVGIIVASYLALIASRYKITARSQCWNTALPVVEAGLEEAMAHLHADAGAPSANGWAPGTVGGQPVHTKTRTFRDGSFFSVIIYKANSDSPTIYSTGYVPSPMEEGCYICRTVKFTPTNAATVFTAAIACQGTIRLAGGTAVDGYNSSAGGYDLSTNRLANAGIATDSSASPAVSIGNAKVYGPVATGPGGTIEILKGEVGDIAWNASQSGIEPGWTNNNMNVAFPPNAPPSGGPFPPPPVVSAGGSNITTLGNSTYQLSSFTSANGKEPLVVTGNAALIVTQDFKVSGSGYVLIVPDARLTLYVGGAIDISGGGLINETALASHCQIIGLPSNTSIALKGNSAFYGAINAPQADVTIGGTADAYGALICRTFTGVGSGNFHYDRALATTNGLVAGGWTEL